MCLRHADILDVDAIVGRAEFSDPCPSEQKRHDHASACDFGRISGAGALWRFDVDGQRINRKRSFDR